MVERGGGKPRPDEETFATASREGVTSGKQVVSQDESGGWYEQDIPHEQLVDTIKGLLDKKRKSYEKCGLDFDPISYIHEELDTQVRFRSRGKDKEGFFLELLFAWDALTFDHYEPGSHTGSLIGWGMLPYIGGERKKSVELEHPMQIKLLDALTEAVGVEHEQGRKTIPIPDHLLYFHKWTQTNEYRERFEETMRKRKL